MFGVPFIQAGSSWFLLIVESAPCGWSWTSGLSGCLDWGSLCLCSGGWSWISSLCSAVKCPVMGFGVFISLGWFWAAHLLMFRFVFLFCWIIIVVLFALELASSWVELGFSVNMETFM